MRLPFLPVVNKIDGVYFVMPQRVSSQYRCIIKCDADTSALLMLFGYEMLDETRLKRALSLGIEDAEEKLKRVGLFILRHNFVKGKLEVVNL